jgi:hypothetical protein
MKHIHNQIPLYKKDGSFDPLRGYCLVCKKYIETNPYNGKENIISFKHIKDLQLINKKYEKITTK